MSRSRTDNLRIRTNHRAFARGPRGVPRTGPSMTLLSCDRQLSDSSSSASGIDAKELYTFGTKTGFCSTRDRVGSVRDESGPRSEPSRVKHLLSAAKSRN